MFDPNDDRPLGAIPEEALEVIIAATEPDEGIERERAEELLLEEGFGSPDAEWAIDRLLERGYCYAVDDELFVTDREVLD